jgi:hypothetical protein
MSSAIPMKKDHNYMSIILSDISISQGYSGNPSRKRGSHRELGNRTRAYHENKLQRPFTSMTPRENSENGEDAAQSQGAPGSNPVLTLERQMTAEPEDIRPPPLAIIGALVAFPMPPRDHFEIMHELFLDDLNMTEAMKGTMRQLGDAVKWEKVVLHLTQRYRDAGQAEEIIEITKLQETPEDMDLLTKLIVSLRSRPLYWIGSFIDSGGLQVLLWNLQSLEDKKRYSLSLPVVWKGNNEFRHDEVEESYIKALKQLMNNKVRVL